MNKLAIVQGITTSHKVIAVCEWATYSYLGGEVNDVHRQGEIEIPVTMRLMNVPAYPSDSPSFEPMGMGVDFTLEDKEIKRALEIKFKFEIDGDGTNYYINREKDGRPMAELRILHYKPLEA